MSGKLTTLQRETLGKIAAGEVWNVRFGYGAWRTQGASATVVGRLVQTMRLAHWGPVEGEDRQPCLLTEAGRASLSKGIGNNE
jgi:hypothetical protein